MGTKFNTDIKLVLSPVYYDEYPEIKLSFDGRQKFNGTLTEKTIFELTSDLEIGTHTIEVHFLNKKNTDTKQELGLDKAVVIESVILEGFDLERFKWAGIYYPNYPEHIKNAEPVLSPATYMGWNGIWILTLEIPIYTWIHKSESLGWIYELDKSQFAQ